MPAVVQTFPKDIPVFVNLPVVDLRKPVIYGIQTRVRIRNSALICLKIYVTGEVYTWLYP
jgi:hypothetical protein